MILTLSLIGLLAVALGLLFFALHGVADHNKHVQIALSVANQNVEKVIALEAQRTRLHAEFERAVAQNKEAETKAQALSAQLQAAQAPLHAPVSDEMDAEEFRAAFDVDNDLPLWQAIHRLLDQEIVAGVDDVAPAPSGVFSSEARTHAAGALNSLREFQKTLLRWQRDARRAKTTTGAESQND